MQENENKYAQKNTGKNCYTLLAKTTKVSESAKSKF